MRLALGGPLATLSRWRARGARCDSARPGRVWQTAHAGGAPDATWVLASRQLPSKRCAPAKRAACIFADPHVSGGGAGSSSASRCRMRVALATSYTATSATSSPLQRRQCRMQAMIIGLHQMQCLSSEVALLGRPRASPHPQARRIALPPLRHVRPRRPEPVVLSLVEGRVWAAIVL